MTTYIKTDVENIFRVKMYVPRGFSFPNICWDILNHEAYSSSKRIKIEKDLIYYIIEFRDIAVNEEKNIRKFCRDTMRKEMVSIKEYNRQKRNLENYLKEWHKKTDNSIIPGK